MAEEKDNIAQNYIESRLALPSVSTDSPMNEVSIIKGLSAENQLQTIYLRLKGYNFDSLLGQWKKTRKPIMNELGIGNFMATLQGISDNVNFSNFDDKLVLKLSLLFFSDNYPHFTTYFKEFELDEKDFNIIKTILQFWALSVLSNAKGAGHRNVVRGTLSEGILARALGGGEVKEKKGLFGFLGRRGRK